MLNHCFVDNRKDGFRQQLATTARSKGEMMKKKIITAAVTGSVYTPSMNPYIPIAPSEIADEVIRSHQAGASVAHIHVRDPSTGMPTSRIELFQEVVSRVKKQSDIVLCFTTGGAP